MMREPTNSHVKPEGHLHQSTGCCTSHLMSTDWKASTDPGSQRSWYFMNISVAMKKLHQEQRYKEQERSVFRLGCRCYLCLGSYQQRWLSFPKWTAQLSASPCLCFHGIGWGKLCLNRKHTPCECRQEEGQARGVGVASAACHCVMVGIREVEPANRAGKVSGLGWA